MLGQATLTDERVWYVRALMRFGKVKDGVRIIASERLTAFQSLPAIFKLTIDNTIFYKKI